MNLGGARKLRRIQRQLEKFYGIERAPDVVLFVYHGADRSRETVLIRQDGEALEIAVVLPPAAFESRPEASHDLLAQVLEAVSHFVYLAERARIGLPLTQLELELQAEVDKFVILALKVGDERDALSALHSRLYEEVSFMDPADSEEGARYRLANDLAARFVARSAGRCGVLAAREELRRFYRAGQAEKIRLARAA